MNEVIGIACTVAAGVVCLAMLAYLLRSRGRAHPVTIIAMATALMGLTLCARFAMSTSNPAVTIQIGCTALMMVLLPLTIWQYHRREMAGRSA